MSDYVTVNRILKQKAAALPPAATPPVLPQDPSIVKAPLPQPTSGEMNDAGLPPPLPPKPQPSLSADAEQPTPWKLAGDWLNKAKDTLQQSTKGSIPGALKGSKLETQPLIEAPPPVQPTSGPTATPTNVICEFLPTLIHIALTRLAWLEAHNIDLAVQACRGESGDVLRTRQSMHEVRETLNESYCDVSGQAENLKLAGEPLSKHFPASRWT